MKLAAKAFDALCVSEIAETAPSDLIASIQEEMLKFAKFTNDEQDLDDIHHSPDFAWLKDEF